ncbi:hypothetical protein [Streptomyces sp. ITFR-16]|uniref:hypothetical protein n=1 Tax=Streptomyces sp. ITFR-16 TaxID=3075198 RepID=UPI00288C50A3|nr:hypothetical protein [Streptomyces sp. ITFR-16]WNI20568.1 hypothetical protein RLT58_00955 [Streptomyces sp. ITFR-16]
MTTEDDARAAILHAFGDSATVHIESFPAGNLSITLARGGHTATIDGHPDSGWGWTVDPVEDDGFTGHENTAPSLDEALAALHAALI